MPSAKEAVTLVDLGATPNPAYIKRSPAIRSLYCGIISLIIICILILYSINKLSTLGGVIDYENHEIKDNPIIILDGFYLDLSLQLFDYNVQPHRNLYLNNENMFEEGFNISILHYSPDKTESMYLTDNKDEKGNPFFTIPANLSKQLTYTSKYNSSYIQLSISKCFSYLSPRCKYIENTDKKSLSILGVFVMNSNHVHDGEVDQQYQLYMDFLDLNKNQSFIKQTYAFNAFQHTQDLSFMPKSITKPNVINSWCYFDSNSRQDQAKYDQGQFLIFQFKASQYTYYSSERMEKIDYILPQIFTLFSLAVLVLTKISFHYRRWALHLIVAHELYGNKKQQRENNSLLTENDTQKNIMGINLRNYFKYLTTKPENSQIVKQTQIKIKKAQKKIDLLEIANEVHKLKKKIKILSRKSKISQQQLQRLVIQQISSQSQSQQYEKMENSNTDVKEKFLNN